MALNIIRCPHCGKDIELTEVLTHQIREAMRVELGDELAKKETAFAAEQAAFRAKEKELAAKAESVQKQVDETLKAERAKLAQDTKALEIQQQSIDEQVAAKVKIEKQKLAEEALKKAKEELGEQSKALQGELEEKNQKLKAFQVQEIELRKQQRKLIEDKDAFELECTRKIDEARNKITEEANKKAAEDNLLKLRQKDDQLESMKRQIDELKRKSELTSQEAQGEALEGSLQDMLQARFPVDSFEEIKKGQRGADILQIVRNRIGNECGKILWESKNTKDFQRGWVEKLKEDQQLARADVAVIMTMALPKDKDFENFGQHDGIWITDYKSAAGLAAALRVGLIEVGRQKAINAGQGSPKDLIFDYVTGKEFALHIMRIVNAFNYMREQLEKEKLATVKLWSKREKQITTVLQNMIEIRGSIEGLLGDQKALPSIDVLSLEDIAEDDGEEETA